MASAHRIPVGGSGSPAGKPCGTRRKVHRELTRKFRSGRDHPGKPFVRARVFCPGLVRPDPPCPGTRERPHHNPPSGVRYPRTAPFIWARCVVPDGRLLGWALVPWSWWSIGGMRNRPQHGLCSRPGSGIYLRARESPGLPVDKDDACYLGGGVRVPLCAARGLGAIVVGWGASGLAETSALSPPGLSGVRSPQLQKRPLWPAGGPFQARRTTSASDRPVAFRFKGVKKRTGSTDVSIPPRARPRAFVALWRRWRAASAAPGAIGPRGGPQGCFRQHGGCGPPMSFPFALAAGPGGVDDDVSRETKSQHFPSGRLRNRGSYVEVWLQDLEPLQLTTPGPPCVGSAQVSKPRGTISGRRLCPAAQRACAIGESQLSNGRVREGFCARGPVCSEFRRGVSRETTTILIGLESCTK